MLFFKWMMCVCMYHYNRIILDLQYVRGDGHSQVRVQSTKVCPRTGLNRGNGCKPSANA